MSIDATAVTIISAAEKAPTAYVMKFDPTKKTLRKASEQLHFTGGSTRPNSYEVIEAAFDSGTFILDEKTRPVVSELVAQSGTAIEAKQLWPRIPRYFDYVEADSLYDADEIDEILLQATRKQGW